MRRWLAVLEGRGLVAAALLALCFVVVDAVSHEAWPRTGFIIALPIAIALACSVLPGLWPRTARSGWSWPIDGGLALGLGLGGTALWTTQLMRTRLSSPLAASDFGDYCEVLLADKSGMPRPESFGWLPGLFVEAHGLIGALTLSTWIWCVLLIAGLYLWGRALHGRVAGVAVVAFASALTPIIVLSRTLNIYPQAVATGVLASAATAAIWRFRHPASSAVCGLALMLCLLSQQRGFFVVLPLVPVALVGSVLGRSRRSALLSVAALVAPLIAAFALHDTVYPEGSTAFTGQVWTAVRTGYLAAGLQPPPVSPTDFSGWLWGDLFAQDIRPVFSDLQDIRALVPPGGFSGGEHAVLRADFVSPWALPTAACAVFVVLRLAHTRRFVPLLLVGLTVGPALAALSSATEILPRIRFLSAGMVGVALLAGLAFGLVVAPDEDRDRREDLRSLVRALLGCGLLLACVSGLTSTWLGPRADWRGVIRPGFAEPAKTIEAVSTDSPDPCARALARDRETFGGIVPGWVERLTPVD